MQRIQCLKLFDSLLRGQAKGKVPELNVCEKFKLNDEKVEPLNDSNKMKLR